MKSKRIKLLVSVRDVEEAKIALEVGVDCIDIKDPEQGPLGRASYAVLSEVAEEIQNHSMLSAALGELVQDYRELDHRIESLPLRYLKWGLNGTPTDSELQSLIQFAHRPSNRNRIIPVAYADWVECRAIPPREVIQLAIRMHAPVLLIDTFHKNGQSLLQHLDLQEIRELRALCHSHKIELALAGSIQWNDLDQFVELSPDWIGVRGLVCTHGDRKQNIDGSLILKLKRIIKNASFSDAS